MMIMSHIDCRPLITTRCRTFVAICLSFFCSLSDAQELQILTENWPPISFGNDTKAEGMAVEVVKAIQAKTGNTQAIQVVPFARGYKALLDESNVLLFTVGRSEEREKLMHLVGPVAISYITLYTRKGNAANLLRQGDAIRKLKVGAYRSSIFADTARKKGFFNLELAVSPLVIANMLMAKRFDLWVEGSIVVPSILKDIGYSSDDVEPVMVLDALELYLAFSAKTPASTIKIWEDALRAIKKDGSFAKIYHKWLPDEVPPMQVIHTSPPTQP